MDRKGAVWHYLHARYPSRKRQQWFSKSCLPLAHDIRRLPLDLFRIDNKTETENGRWMAREEEACSFVAADCPEGSLPSKTTYSPELHAGFGSKFTLSSCGIQLQVYCMTSSSAPNFRYLPSQSQHIITEPAASRFVIRGHHLHFPSPPVFFFSLHGMIGCIIILDYYGNVIDVAT